METKSGIAYAFCELKYDLLCEWWLVFLVDNSPQEVRSHC